MFGIYSNYHYLKKALKRKIKRIQQIKRHITNDHKKQTQNILTMHCTIKWKTDFLNIKIYFWKERNKKFLKQSKNIPNTTVRHKTTSQWMLLFYIGHCQMYHTYFRTCYIRISIFLFYLLPSNKRQALKLQN